MSEQQEQSVINQDAVALAMKQRHEAIALKSAQDAGAPLTENEKDRLAKGINIEIPEAQLTELEILEKRETDGPPLTKAEKVRLKELRKGSSEVVTEE